MFTKTPTCTDISPIIEKLCLHPLEAIRGNIMACVGGNGNFCIDSTISNTFTEDLAIALAEAECLVQQATGVSPCLKQECETLEYPKTRVNSDGFCCPMRTKNGDDWKAVKLRKNRLVTTGTLIKALVAENVTIVYSDVDADGWAEVATVTIPALGAPDLCTLQSYVAGENGDDLYRIKPVVSRDEIGGNYVLTYNAWDTLKPSSLMPSLADRLYNKKIDYTLELCCDPADDDCPLLNTVDVYSLTIDTETCPAEISYGGGVDKCGCGSDSCISETSPACTQESNLCNYVRIVPAEVVTVDDVTTCQAAHSCTCRVEPDKVKINYIGGCSDCYDGCFDPDLSCMFNALYWLTLARLKVSNCGCDKLNDIAFAQKQSTIVVFGGEEQPQGHPDYKHPLFPTIVANNRQGEREAWGYLKPFINNGQCYDGKIP